MIFLKKDILLYLHQEILFHWKVYQFTFLELQVWEYFSYIFMKDSV